MECAFYKWCDLPSFVVAKAVVAVPVVDTVRSCSTLPQHRPCRLRALPSICQQPNRPTLQVEIQCTSGARGREKMGWEEEGGGSMEGRNREGRRGGGRGKSTIEGGNG